MIKSFFSPPVFEREGDNFRARFINGFAWGSILFLALAMIPYLTRPRLDFTVDVLFGLIVVMFVALYVLHRRRLMASGILIISLGWLGLAIQAYTAYGVKDVIIIIYIALSLLASIIFDWRMGGVVILASIAVMWALAVLEANGTIYSRPQNPIDIARNLTFIFLVIMELIYASTNSLKEAVTRASQSEADLIISNKKLQELNQNLEERVESRTSELETANSRNEKRARQFEAIAQIARATAANENLEALLPRLVSLISEQFDFYHAGIFLLDENRKFTVLRAASSAGGKRMLEKGHRFPVGQAGIVGFVSATGTPRIALDVGSDAVFFNNPDLPNTHSEIGLPLLIGNEIIGVLDVQSNQPNDFQQEDVEVLTTLANQVSIGIQNARTYEALQELRRETQKAAEAYLQNSWQILESSEEQIGYRVTDTDVTPLTELLENPEVKKAFLNKQTVIENGETTVLTVPILMRNEAIGVMDIRNPSGREWDEDEIDIAEAVAERLSLSLETSLLLKSTQRRAEIERLTANISGKIGATTQFDAIIRTAAEELSRALGGSEVLVQIQSNTTDENPKN